MTISQQKITTSFRRNYKLNDCRFDIGGFEKIDGMCGGGWEAACTPNKSSNFQTQLII
jgi:hypothetical protein